MSSESYIVFNYSKSDDEANDDAGAEKHGWVSELKEALTFRLGQLLGAGERPQGEVVVAVVSPGYVEDTSSTEELRRLLAGSAAGRIFKVVKSPVSRDRLPVELRDLPGYELYSTNPETGEVHELSRGSSGVLCRRYWARLTDLAADVSRTLRGQEAPAEDSRAVFLAETSEDLREERLLIYRELTQRGLRVLPEGPLPPTAAELRRQVRDQLSRCRLSVHPMGRGYGEIPEGGEESLVALQAELAVERGTEGDFSRLVWMPPYVEPEDERQKDLVERLLTDSRTGAGFDFLVTSLEKLKLAVLRALDEHVAAELAAGEPCQVFLICDQRDVERCRPLRQHLVDRGVEVALPSFEGDESAVRHDHERKLCLCDAVLIHWGEASDDWLHGMLLEVRKSLGLGRTKPFPETVVYVDAPETPEKAGFVAGNGQATARALEDLGPWLGKLDRQGAGR